LFSSAPTLSQGTTDSKDYLDLFLIQTGVLILLLFN